LLFALLLALLLGESQRRLEVRATPQITRPLPKLLSRPPPQ
jgi:hypothetical protein